MTHLGLTQTMKHIPSKALNETTTILMSSLTTLSCTPSTLKLPLTLEINKANQRIEVEGTTPKALIDHSVGVNNERVQGDVVDQTTHLNVMEGVTGQV